MHSEVTQNETKQDKIKVRKRSAIWKWIKQGEKQAFKTILHNLKLLNLILYLNARFEFKKRN
jgi:hypothetical protein